MTGQRQTRSSKGKDDEVQPNKPAIPEDKQPAKKAAEPDKEVSVSITQADVVICKTNKLPSAKRAKPFMGHTDPGDDNHKEIIIEDCQVPVDNTSYAD